jgi:adenylate cyclase
MRRLGELIWPVVIALVVAGLTTWAYMVRPAGLEVLELKAFDLRLAARGGKAPSGQVVVVAVDEASLERVGRWPWDRGIIARLVERIDAAGPRAVGYDIIFSEPQANPAGEELARLIGRAGELGLSPTPELKAYLRERLAETGADGRLARALAGARAPQVLGYYFNFEAAAGSGAENGLEGVAAYFEKQLDAAEGPARIPVPEAKKARTNQPLLAKAAGAQAYFNVVPDQDGTVRRYAMAVGFEGGYYQPLAAALFGRAVPAAPPFLLATVNGLVGAEWERHVVPTDEAGRMILNWRGGAGAIPHLPAWQVLAGEVDPARLAGKYVLVGVTAPTVYDMRVTPVSVAYPGTEIHATALDAMLMQDFILRPGWAPLFDLGAVWLFAAVTVAYLWRARTLLTLIGFAALAAVFLALNQYFFATRQFWLNLVYPMVAFGLTYVALNTYRYVFADRQKKQIKSAFAKYLDPSVVEQVTDDPERLSLGGEALNLTVLFSDIRGFTGISERLSPVELVAFLNEYLTAMTDIVMRRKGLLDKYIGDAVMAVFGAPYPYPEHALEACRTAWEMQQALKELNVGWAGRGLPEIAIGVGVNTAEMVAGNMGSRDRFNYTVIGDGVNLASRLEGLNKVYATRIIVSESTQALVGEQFWARTLDLVRVKGRESPVEIFELLGPIEEPQPLEYMAEYLELVADYRAGRFGQARAGAERLAAAHPEDKVLGVYAERLRQLEASPPESWDGVYTFTTK